MHWNCLQFEHRALYSKPAKKVLNKACMVVKEWCGKIYDSTQLQTFGDLSVGRMPWATTFCMEFSYQA